MMNDENVDGMDTDVDDDVDADMDGNIDAGAFILIRRGHVRATTIRPWDAAYILKGLDITPTGTFLVVLPAWCLRAPEEPGRYWTIPCRSQEGGLSD